MSDERELYEAANPHRELPNEISKDRVAAARRILEKTEAPTQKRRCWASAAGRVPRPTEGGR